MEMSTLSLMNDSQIVWSLANQIKQYRFPHSGERKGALIWEFWQVSVHLKGWRQKKWMVNFPLILKKLTFTIKINTESTGKMLAHHCRITVAHSSHCEFRWTCNRSQVLCTVFWTL